VIVSELSVLFSDLENKIQIMLCISFSLCYIGSVTYDNQQLTQEDTMTTTTNPTQEDKTMYTVKIIFNANVSPDVAQFNSLDEAKEYGLNHANTFDLIEIRFRKNNRNIILVADMRSSFEFYEV